MDTMVLSEAVNVSEELAKGDKIEIGENQGVLGPNIGEIELSGGTTSPAVDKAAVSSEAEATPENLPESDIQPAEQQDPATSSSISRVAELPTESTHPDPQVNVAEAVIHIPSSDTSTTENAESEPSIITPATGSAIPESSEAETIADSASTQAPHLEETPTVDTDNVFEGPSPSPADSAPDPETSAFIVTSPVDSNTASEGGETSASPADNPEPTLPENPHQATSEGLKPELDVEPTVVDSAVSTNAEAQPEASSEAVNSEHSS